MAMQGSPVWVTMSHRAAKLERPLSTMDKIGVPVPADPAWAVALAALRADADAALPDLPSLDADDEHPAAAA